MIKKIKLISCCIVIIILPPPAGRDGYIKPNILDLFMNISGNDISKPSSIVIYLYIPEKYNSG